MSPIFDIEFAMHIMLAFIKIAISLCKHALGNANAAFIRQYIFSSVSENIEDLPYNNTYTDKFSVSYISWNSFMDLAFVHVFMTKYCSDPIHSKSVY